MPRYAAAFDRAGMPVELIVVPNASTDATESQVQALAAADPRVRCVANPYGGWGRSVRIGLEAARGQVLVYTNSARTDPETLPEFVRRHLERPQSLVKAARRQRNALLREVGSTLYNLEARVLFGVRCSDVNGTPKVFSRLLYDQISLTQDGDLARPGTDRPGNTAQGLDRGHPDVRFQTPWRQIVHDAPERLADVCRCAAARTPTAESPRSDRCRRIMPMTSAPAHIADDWIRQRHGSSTRSPICQSLTRCCAGCATEPSPSCT